MIKNFSEALTKNKKDFFRFLNAVASSPGKLLVKGNLLDIFHSFSKDNSITNIEALEWIINKITESVTLGSCIRIEVREKIAETRYYLFNLSEFYFEEINPVEYLKIKEIHVNQDFKNDLLTLNFNTFYDKFPSVRESKSIGKGVEYLNRYLSSKMFTEPEKLRSALFDFLFVHKHNSQQLILNDRIKSPEDLSSGIDKALQILGKMDEDVPYDEIKHKLQELGFEPGLGNSSGLIKQRLEELDRLLQSPDHLALKQFLSGIPMIFNIAVITPHGFFGQEGVLGRPDTGGQIVYILDQVKALEREMCDSLKKAGLEANPKIIILTRLIPNAEGTNANQRLEKVYDTRNVWILRIPFRTHNEKVTSNWISRFEIWPYLEEFAEDSSHELVAEFGTKPDLVIGNYSDGNLVATILSKKFGITQCNIAHALEKSKYLYSALYWQSMEEQYHFSVQFTADLIAMNAANFIITSTYQEITGTEDSIGQYESYKIFTMPGLYRVVGGINLFHPKFNILPPGVNTKIFFPYYQKQDRIKEVTEEVTGRIFTDPSESDGFGKFDNPDLIPVFSMARLDKIKNLTSLVQWYGEHEKLREVANLVIIAGKTDPGATTDSEEREQIELMHRHIETYNLYGKLRWIPGDGDRRRVPEYYRIIADRNGVFVQPALFEGFGLTVLEAMRSGLPVFATHYGGPREIIQDEVSGFHIDPVNGELAAQKIYDFILNYTNDINIWKKISEKAIKRVDDAFNWKLYSDNLLSLAKIYGFWRYTTNVEMEELNSYLEVLYHLLYKPRAAKILESHNLK
ncbi:MAG: sucrose synthase [Ignavibacteriaceae bacterium]